MELSASALTRRRNLNDFDISGVKSIGRRKIFQMVNLRHILSRAYCSEWLMEVTQGAFA